MRELYISYFARDSFARWRWGESRPKKQRPRGMNIPKTIRCEVHPWAHGKPRDSMRIPKIQMRLLNVIQDLCSVFFSSIRLQCVCSVRVWVFLLWCVGISSILCLCVRCEFYYLTRGRPRIHCMKCAFLARTLLFVCELLAFVAHTPRADLWLLNFNDVRLFMWADQRPYYMFLPFVVVPIKHHNSLGAKR